MARVPTETEAATYFRLIVATSEDAIVGVTLDGEIVIWNNAAERIFGYSESEMIGRSIATIIPADRSDDKTQLLDRIRNGRTIERHRTVRRRRDGTSVEVQLNLSPIRNESGEITGAFAIVKDVTRGERAQEQLRFQAQLLDNMQESLVAIDLEGRIVYWGKGAEALYGYRGDEVIGKEFGLIMPAETRQAEQERLREALDQGSWRGECLRRKKGGTPFWAESFVSVVREEGRSRGFISVDHDITARREADRALRESEERFRLAFEEGPMGLALVRQDFTLLRANSAFCSMLGYRETELIGRTFVDVTHPDDVAEDTALARQLFRGEIPSYTFVKRYVTKTGATCWARLTASVIRGEDGRPRYGLAMVEDITEHKQAEELVRRSERLASIGTFAAGIAHQINNPLGGILMASQFALRAKGEPEAPRLLEQAIRDIEADALRCADIVKSMLRFARHEPIKKSPCRLAEVLEGVVRLTRKEANERQAVVVVERSAAKRPLMASKTELEQAIGNVVQNAIQSRPQGARVVVRVSYGNRCARVSVRDNGRGVPEEHREFLFDPFYTTRREEGGTGLGLSLTHAIVEAHDGRIEIDSATGGGTIVTIELPIDEDAEMDRG